MEGETVGLSGVKSLGSWASNYATNFHSGPDWW